ncbi:MAG: energy-coupling factor transporter transmembrane protein EcfT [Deltaproteobacteria bacterium]|jgi:energy-coupling factor transport system permease protein|nr:energy-coupling factor transporter transmembrane protein EcfT [Deltaproteobacteria bacterium]
MPGLSDKFKNAATGRLNLAPETRLALTLMASIFSLIFSDGISLGILAAASAVYLVLEVRPKATIIVYIAFTVMATVAMISLKLLGLFMAAMKGQPLYAALFPFIRMSITLNTILPLAFNARLSDLASTMGRLKIPGLIRLPLIITVRFIPTFFNDLTQLREAVAIRFRRRGGFFFWLNNPVIAWRVFFMPLVVRLIRSADELAIAAELKGLSASTDFGDGRLMLKQADRVALSLATIGISLASIFGNLYA